MKIYLKAPSFAALAVILLAGWTMMPDMSIQPESKLWVEGTSTIHDWTMTVGAFDGSVTATTGEIGAVSVTVPVAQLTADNGTMNKKAQKALRADKHPTITYNLTSADLKGAGSFEAKGQLTIAGVTQPANFAVKGEQVADGRFRYTGSTRVNMSDFGVKAPTAMLGTIKTGDEVVVHFNVVAD